MSMQTLNNRKVMIAGATGLVGSLILSRLLADRTVSEVYALSRRPLQVKHPKLHAMEINFLRLPVLPDVHEVYLALGTTMKVAGSKAAFRAVDLEANLAVARAAKFAGARRVGLVSAAGADSQSSMFYNRTKGELEDALKLMEFTGLTIAQPSLLLDSRAGLNQPVRLGEILTIPIAKAIAPILPAAYKPVHAKDVATTLVSTTPKTQGVAVLDSAELIRIAQSR